MLLSTFPFRFRGKLANLEILLSISPDRFGDAVVTVTAHTAVDIGIDSSPGAGPIEPAMLAFAGKGVLLA